uniref:ATP synthase F0 subunit 8 n=1 Tax=Knipowitschia caucasica TaxID=637954 RepID=A0AAV2LZB0_KNICA
MSSTFGLLIGVFVLCGLALVALLSFVSWRFCWLPWRNKPLLSSSAGQALSPCAPELRLLTPNRSLPPVLPPQSPVTMATEKVKDPLGSMGFLEAAVKISHTSPDIPTDVQLSMREHFLRRTQRMQRQTTEPASSTSVRM